MYNLIKKQIKNNYFQQRFSNDGQRFVAWYLRNILFRDMNETRDDITDGTDDKQIDAIIIDDDNSIVRVIQGKFIQGGVVDAEPLREILSSWIQIKNLCRLQNVANGKLQRKLSELAAALEEDYEVSFELITTGKLTESARDDLETFQKELANLGENDDLDATIHVIDNDELRRRYEYAIESDNPSINFKINLSGSKFMFHEIAGTPVIIAALPLKECLKFPGIKDGTLFQKNVRQSLGTSNAVNKGIRNTITGDKRSDFFFFHNGITALCNKMDLDGEMLSLHSLSVVNGCQSLNTILSCSEIVKKVNDSFILVRFYEIPQRDRADKISIYTNSQSAVKARDLRSNDKPKCSLTAGEGDSGRSGPANQVRKGRDHVQAGHPILEVRPEGDALFATGLLEAGEGVAASSPVRAAGASADVPFLHHVPQVGLAAVVVDR